MEGEDYFIIKPLKNVPVFSYAPTLASLKFSTMASVFTREVWWTSFFFHHIYPTLFGEIDHQIWQVLEASPTLCRSWRVVYMKAEKDYSSLSTSVQQCWWFNTGQTIHVLQNKLINHSCIWIYFHSYFPHLTTSPGDHAKKLGQKWPHIGIHSAWWQVMAKCLEKDKLFCSS